MTLALHIDEGVAEVLDRCGETPHSLLRLEGGLGDAMIKRAIGLSPSGISAGGTGRAYKTIGVGLRERMKKGVVSRASRTAKPRLLGPTA